MLMVDVGKKYNYRTLYRMRKFYEKFNNEKLTPLVSKLSWSHYIELLMCKNENEIKYYIETTLNNNYSKRQLHDLIKNNSYNRLSIETKIKLISKEKLKLDDLIPNPIIIKSNNLTENLNEYALKEYFINNLDYFLNQLGPCYSYVGNEYKIKIGDRYNYIDILLFNYEYNCFVVVELKVTELKKEHIGQIEIYMNYIDKNIKGINHDNTIGIIICKKNNKYIIGYSSDNRIISREYEVNRL